MQKIVVYRRVSVKLSLESIFTAENAEYSHAIVRGMSCSLMVSVTEAVTSIGNTHNDSQSNDKYSAFSAVKSSPSSLSTPN